MPLYGNRNRSPGTALALGIGEHAVGELVRAAVATVLAGEGLVGANGFTLIRLSVGLYSIETPARSVGLSSSR